MSPPAAPRLRQLDFDDAVRMQNYAIRQARDGTLVDRFARWVEKHGEVLDRAAEVALELKRQGYRHYSIDGVWHILRYKQGLSAPTRTGSASPETPEWVNLNNDFTAPAARLLMEREPRLAGFFRLRRSQVDAPMGRVG